jgi:hypothetical protein
MVQAKRIQVKKEEKAPTDSLAESSHKDLAEIGLDSKNKAEKEGELDKQELLKLREEIEKADLGILESQAQDQADDLKPLKDDQKVKILLQLAKKRGIIYAVGVARKLDNHYVLDALHDKLEESGLYKDFIN